jgi:hypothetical protein
MGLTGCPETLVINYQSMVHNSPEERRSHLHCGRSLKSSRKRGKLILYYQVEMLCSESRKHEWCITEGDDNDQALNLLRSLVPYMRQLPPTKKDRSSRTQWQIRLVHYKIICSLLSLIYNPKPKAWRQLA